MREFAEPQHDHGAWEYELDTHRARWSNALYEIHGVERETFDPTVENVSTLVHPDDRETYLAIVRDAIATRTPFASQHRIVRPDGDTRVVTIRASFVEGFADTPDRLIGTTRTSRIPPVRRTGSPTWQTTTRSPASTTAIASWRSSRARSHPGVATAPTERSSS